MYLVCALLRNTITCLYGNQTSEFYHLNSRGIFPVIGLKANYIRIEKCIIQSMYPFEHWASKSAIFKSSEIHVNFKLKAYTTTTTVCFN